MARTLYLVLALAVLFAGGCGKGNQLSCEKQCQVQDATGFTKVEPEGLISRPWPKADITYNSVESIEPSPYFNSYESLDENYSCDTSSSKGRKGDIKRAVFDPIVTLKDVLVAPLKYSSDKYKERKAAKEQEENSSVQDN